MAGLSKKCPATVFPEKKKQSSKDHGQLKIGRAIEKL